MQTTEEKKLVEDVNFWKEISKLGYVVFEKDERFFSKKVDIENGGFIDDTYCFADIDSLFYYIAEKIKWCAARQIEYKVQVVLNIGLGPEFHDIEHVFSNSPDDAQLQAEAKALKFITKEPKFAGLKTWEAVKIRPIFR